MCDEPARPDSPGQELPIACSLGTADLERRLDGLAELGAAGLLDAEGEGARHTLRFRDEPALRARLEDIVAAEAECCPFLGLEIESGRGVLTLRVEAPGGGESVAEGLVAAIGGGRPDATNPTVAISRCYSPQRDCSASSAALPGRRCSAPRQAKPGCDC